MNDIIFDRRLAQRLGQRLSAPQALPRSTVSPELSYGRHRGPSNVGSRVAAVVVALYFCPNGNGWTIPLTLRPTSLSHHGGQVCLPGGRLERNESVLHAAMREFEEELGVRPEVLQVCGQLSTQYVYASDNVVHPLVVAIAPPAARWRPDPIEVEKVIELPLATLLNSANRIETTRCRTIRHEGREVGQLTFRATAIRYDCYEIWGATALILDQLAQMLHQMDRDSERRQIDTLG